MAETFRHTTVCVFVYWQWRVPRIRIYISAHQRPYLWPYPRHIAIPAFQEWRHNLTGHDHSCRKGKSNNRVHETETQPVTLEPSLSFDQQWSNFYVLWPSTVIGGDSNSGGSTILKNLDTAFYRLLPPKWIFVFMRMTWSLFAFQRTNSTMSWHLFLSTMSWHSTVNLYKNAWFQSVIIDVLASIIMITM